MRARLISWFFIATSLVAGTGKAAEIAADQVNAATFSGTVTEGQSPLVVKLQVLLDRAGVSPGVMDGYMGENVENALMAFEEIQGLPVDGKLDADTWSALGGDDTASVLVEYTVTEEDAAGPFVDEIPEDYAEKAEMESMAFTSIAEMLAERFHMDIDLFKALNGEGALDPGDTVTVADPGEDISSSVARIEVSRSSEIVRGYDEAGNLVAHYPATVGSDSLPSPEGTHEVAAIAPDPNYTYDPELNFQQGDNTEKLIIPPGPNGPVGTMWIDLSEPTYGIHGTDEPASIGKAASHGCVRLTNWDATELAGRIEEGVPVAFVD